MKTNARGATALLAALAASAVWLLPTGADAADVVLNSVLDLSLAGVTASSVSAGDYSGFPAALPLTAPFEVAEGDTFIWNLDFKGNQTLTVENLALLTPLVFTLGSDPKPATVRMTGRIDLLDAGGQVVATAQKTDTNGAVHIGQLWQGLEFGSPVSLTFSGFHYSGVVEEYGTVHPAIPDYAVRTYDGPSFYLEGSRVSVGEAVAVPEPAAWVLLIAGFGLTGGALRRRKAAASRA
jgi:hypothetical protein